MNKEPVFDIAHVGHVELLTPKFEESKCFFIDVLGMEEVRSDHKSTYLRCYGDYEQYSLKLTRSERAGIGHTAFRTMSPEALERRAALIEQQGFGSGWTDGDFGHGKAYQFHDEDGHILELYYETEYYQAPLCLKPALKNQPQKFTGRGVSVKHLDHVNFLSSNVEADGDMVENALSLRLTEQIELNNGYHPGKWYRATNKSYDLVYTHDSTGEAGRLHHIAFAVDTNEAIWRAADIFVENNVYIGFAPSKHAINQTYFVYVYEPGGNYMCLDSVACNHHMTSVNGLEDFLKKVFRE